MRGCGHLVCLSRMVLECAKLEPRGREWRQIVNTHRHPSCSDFSTVVESTKVHRLMRIRNDEN